VHRPRRRAAVLSSEDDVPQAWVPRVVNAALAGFFLLFLVPLFTHLGGLSRVAQVLLVLIAIPFALLTVGCLSAALRPGSVGRFARRLRPRR